ncbi:MAG TPA: hypothetical protein V6C86_21350 [Oculatellaceae cyanobacterium]
MKKKYSYRLLSMVIAIIIQPCPGEAWSTGMYIGQPSSESMRQKFRHWNLNQIEVGGSADLTLFDDSTLFKHLQLITLSGTEAQNNTWLKSLSNGYPNITAITIHQKEPISTDSLKLLQSFKRLNYLGVVGSPSDVSTFASFVPVTVTQLNLSSRIVTTWSFPHTPSITTLRINQNDPIDSKFIDGLDFPNLHLLDFGNSPISPGTLAHVEKFRKLKVVTATKEVLTKADYQYIKKLGIKYMGTHE